MPDVHRTCTVILRSVFLLTCVIILSSPAVAQDDPFTKFIRDTPPLTPEDERLTFTLPDGFRVQLFAAEPDIQKPMNMAFDSQGRLWVSGSNDYPFPAAPGEETASMRILEDTDHDGRADKATTFVDGITIPMGLYPYKDGVVAFAIPNIWHFRDTDGDGTADRRDVLYGPFDCSRDTHGLNNAFRRGFDGWVYACHGFNNQSQVAGSDGHEITLRSGNTYRFRLDGSRIEHFTWGQVNPFGMTFDPLGDIYTSDCHTKPISLLIRDGYYPSFGGPHDGLGFVPPVMTHSHGSTAIAGVMQQTGDGFPKAYRRSLYLGNVMTSRVHRDTLEYVGSSVRAVAQDDFMVSTDPWFRPVDIQCGPDGALYVADFYNRIIGHYEVPLDHPGRDRHRARIWRIVHDSAPGQPDLSLRSAATEALITALDDSHLGTRMHATDELTDRVGDAAAPQLLDALGKDPSPDARVHLLWALQRLDRWPTDVLLDATNQADPVVRIHAMRILGDQTDWGDPLRTAVLEGLEDEAALVRRAAAGALAQHSHPAHGHRLLHALDVAPPEDVHLIHALKIALRNQLRDPDNLMALMNGPLPKSGDKWIAETLQAVDSPEMAVFLLRQADLSDMSDADLARVLSSAAKNIDAADIDRFVEIARTRFNGHWSRQLELLDALSRGLASQRIPAGQLPRQWALDVARAVIQSHSDDESTWVDLPGNPSIDNPWGLEQRDSSDARRQTMYLSSLPGGERAVHTLRSVEFEIPAKLTFYLCGHLGFPKDAAIEKNIVRLRLVQDDETIAQALPPRNDVAQPVEWDLSAHTGQRGYIELVDGIDLRAYAWLAVSRFDPPVVRVPKTSPQRRNAELRSVAALAGRHRLQELTPELRQLATSERLDPSARGAAARVLATFHSDPRRLALAALVDEAATSPALRSAICGQLIDEDADALDRFWQATLKQLPAALERNVAESLAGSQEGATLLLDSIDQGRMSARLLQRETLRAALLAGASESRQARIEALIASSVPPLQRAGLIDARQESFRQASVDAERGKAVFIKRCAVCHQMQGEGKVVGPQLDGIGNRGLRRLLEDILDPNRNVDVAFRSHTYLLDDGRVHSGLFRRNEGNRIVLADGKAEETSIPRDEIDEQTVSTVSIMPDNWGDVLTESELANLLRYLLDQRAVIKQPGS